MIWTFWHSKYILSKTTAPNTKYSKFLIILTSIYIFFFMSRSFIVFSHTQNRPLMRQKSVCHIPFFLQSSECFTFSKICVLLDNFYHLFKLTFFFDFLLFFFDTVLSWSRNFFHLNFSHFTINLPSLLFSSPFIHLPKNHANQKPKRYVKTLSLQTKIVKSKLHITINLNVDKVQS